MWEQFKRVIKPRGAIVLTASQPFTSKLVMSAIDWFKYSWVWIKNNKTNFGNAKFQPMRAYEDVLVFNSRFYYPQNLKRVDRLESGYKSAGGFTRQFGKPGVVYVQEYENYPDNVLFFNCPSDTIHPTQKPVALFEYLIRTYTQPGEIVLDPCIGSGTTAIAARNTGRHFIGGDITPEYVNIARARLAMPYTPPLFLD